MNRFTAILCLLISAVFAAAVGYKIFYADSMAVYQAIVLHVLSAASCAAGMFLLSTAAEAGRRKEDNLWWVYSLVLCILIPLYGVFVSIATFVFHIIRGRHLPPVVSEDVDIIDPVNLKNLIRRSRQIEVMERLDIEPFIDILQGGSAELKRGAIKELGNIRSRSAILMLTQALKDSDIEVRLYAAGVLGKLEEGYTKEIKRCAVLFERNPDATENGVSLVENYLLFTESGLLDPGSQKYYYNEALRVLERLPSETGTDYLNARVRFLLAEYDKALKLIDQCIKKDPMNASYQQLKCEILFGMRDYKSLGPNIETYVRENKDRRSGAVEFWA